MVLIVWWLVITHKNLGCPAETRLARQVCRPGPEPGDHRCFRNEKLLTLGQALWRSCHRKLGLHDSKMERVQVPEQHPRRLPWAPSKLGVQPSVTRRLIPVDVESAGHVGQELDQLQSEPGATPAARLLEGVSAP